MQIIKGVILYHFEVLVPLSGHFPKKIPVNLNVTTAVQAGFGRTYIFNLQLEWKFGFMIERGNEKEV